MNKIIYLITTYKCSACKCMKAILKLVQEDDPSFNIEVYDFTDAPEFIKVNVKFGDFPTTVFVKDNIIKYSFKGTLSKKKVEQIIKDIDY